MIKKILVAVAALTLTVTSMTACSKAGDSSSGNVNVSGGDVSGGGSTGGGLTPEIAATAEIEKSLTVNGETIDTTDLVICTVNGQDVLFDEYRYYWLSYYDTYSKAGFDMTSELAFNSIRDSVESLLVNQYGIIALGVENGVKADDDVQKMADEDYLDLIGGFEDVQSYAEALDSAHMTDYVIKNFYYIDAYSNKIIEFLISDDSPYMKSEDDFRAALENGEFSRTLNLLITYSGGAELSAEDKEAWDELTTSQKSSKYDSAYYALSSDGQKAARDNAKKIAEDVLAKARSGEDFYKLIAEYNLDPGMKLNDADDITSIDGYYITKDYSFVKEYIDGAFALKENEISDLVETSYGYHIIKRLPLDMDYVEKNFDQMYIEYSDTYVDKAVYGYLDTVEVKYADFFEDITIDSIK